MFFVDKFAATSSALTMASAPWHLRFTLGVEVMSANVDGMIKREYSRVFLPGGRYDLSHNTAIASKEGASRPVHVLDE